MSNLEQPFRSDAGAALERVARLQDENAQLRDALARASRSGSRRERRARTRRTVRLVVGALAVVALGVTALLGMRAPQASAAPPAVTLAQAQTGPAIGWALAVFDRDAADRALAAVDVQACADSAVHYVDGLNEGTITVSFAPDGKADGASLKSAAFDGSAVGGCIVKQFQGLHVAPFSGITDNYVTRSFRIH
jgi:hypothetical protein